METRYFVYSEEAADFSVHLHKTYQAALEISTKFKPYEAIVVKVGLEPCPPPYVDPELHTGDLVSGGDGYESWYYLPDFAADSAPFLSNRKNDWRSRNDLPEHIYVVSKYRV